MNAQYDVVVIGAGPGGEVCAARLAKAGRRVAIVESERVGGECAFWACIPSKALLRSEEPYAASQRVPGSQAGASGRLSFAQAAAWRNDSVSNYDDTEHVPFLRDNHVDLIRGEARVDEPGVVRVGDNTYSYKTLVIATGSDPSMPPIEGLTDGRVWTPREATSAQSIPKRLGIVGGGPVGVELGQVFARYGSQVTIVEPGPHILSREEPEVGKLMAETLAADGIKVLNCTGVKRIEWLNGSASMSLQSGETIQADEILVAAGRTGRSKTFNADALGLKIEKGAISIDDQCRAAENIYAVGDVNGVALFTHVAKYQARIAADAILGKDARARYDAVPRCTYTDPEIGSTGLTESQAREKKLNLSVARVDLTSAARANIYFDKPAAGFIKLIADRDSHALLGASIVGPMASEMVGMASTAIHNKMRVEELLQVVQPFPTFSEAFFYALEALDLK